MGYACPVCGDPQADAGHLANHLAFTAMIRDDGHEAWLDEHAGGWAEWGEADLADHLRDHEAVDEADYPQVFEDTTGQARREREGERSGALFDDDHTHAGSDRADHTGAGGGREAGGLGSVDVDPASDDLSDEERAAIVEEARELTRQMYADGADGDAGTGDGADGDAGTGDGADDTADTSDAEDDA